MGGRATRMMSDFQLRQLAAATGLPLWRLYEIYGAYRYYSLPFFGLRRRGYVKMYRTYNPLYSAYAPEMADRAFYTFDRNRNGRLNFYEFLTSVLSSQGQPGYAMNVPQYYAPTIRPGWVSYPQPYGYTNLLHRYQTPYRYTRPHMYAGRHWGHMHPYSYSYPHRYYSYTPQQNYYNYIRYNSLLTTYYQQPYAGYWPKVQSPYLLQQSTPTLYTEEVYPLATQYQQTQPVTWQPGYSQVCESVFPLATQYQQMQPAVYQPIPTQICEEVFPLGTQYQQIQPKTRQPILSQICEEVYPLSTQYQQLQPAVMQPSLAKVHEDIIPLNYFQTPPNLWANNLNLNQCGYMQMLPQMRPTPILRPMAPIVPMACDC